MGVTKHRKGQKSSRERVVSRSHSMRWGDKKRCSLDILNMSRENRNYYIKVISRQIRYDDRPREEPKTWSEEQDEHLFGCDKGRTVVTRVRDYGCKVPKSSTHFCADGDDKSVSSIAVQAHRPLGSPYMVRWCIAKQLCLDCIV